MNHGKFQLVFNILLYDMLASRKRLLSNRELLGRWGEGRCERFLKRKGLRTLTRNFSCKSGEIDLIMVDTDGCVVFVEVRTKADEDFSQVEESITGPKKIRLRKTVRYFLATHKIQDRPLRFDIVTIVLGRTGKEQIRHYENALTI